MADFCKACSIKTLGEDSKDLAGLGDGSVLEEGYGWGTICEGCGPIIVDDHGKCMTHNHEEIK